LALLRARSHGLTRPASAKDETEEAGLPGSLPLQTGESPTRNERRQQIEELITDDEKPTTQDDKERKHPRFEKRDKTAGNVIEFPGKATAVYSTKDYSDWVTVEKRRVSEGVYAHYVRVKDDAGQKKVGLIDYISITDFNKRFTRRKKHYEAYKTQLIAVYQATSVRAGERAVPNPGRSV
jgi:hypothetical protein